LLDILLEINNSPQIPSEKRIDLSLPPPSEPSAPVLDIDKSHNASQKAIALKRLEELISNVPHLSYNKTKEAHPSLVVDLHAVEGETHPAHFLSADDVDNYIYAVDTALEPEVHIPTLAPNARPNSHALSHPHLKNPTSVTNWLRKHAPKVFLQDGEGHTEPADAEGNAVTVTDGAAGHTTTRKPRGGSKAERGGRASTRGKRASNASVRASAPADGDASMDDDGEFGTPVAKGKRKRDDDGGYRPRGSGSRPAKKKRKSEGAEGTPTVRKAKKETPAGGKED
jgi:hypothetical protein